MTNLTVESKFLFAHSKDLALSSKYKIIEQTFLDDGTKLYLAQKMCGFRFRIEYVTFHRN